MENSIFFAHKYNWTKSILSSSYKWNIKDSAKYSFECKIMRVVPMRHHDTNLIMRSTNRVPSDQKSLCHRHIGHTSWINLEEGKMIPSLCPQHGFRFDVLVHSSTSVCYAPSPSLKHKSFASWQWCPSHQFDRSLYLRTVRFWQTTDHSTALSALSFYPWGFTQSIFTQRGFSRTQNPKSSIWGASDIGPVISESQLANRVWHVLSYSCVMLNIRIQGYLPRVS